MGLFFRNTSVLDSFRNDKHFAWTKRNDTIAKLNGNAAAENKEKIICIDVLVLYKLASDFDQYKVVTVELSDHTWLPILCKRRELLGRAYGLHEHLRLASSSTN